MAKAKVEPVPEREGISRALWLVPAVAALDLLYYFLLSMGFYGSPPGIQTRWIYYISVGIQGALLVGLAVSHAMDRRATAVCEDDAGPVAAEEVEEIPAAKPKAAPAAPARAAPAPKAPEAAKPAGKEVFEYPPKVSGGIYADSHIPVGEGKFLKLRTIIARSCLLCDEQGKCWDIVRTDMDQDFFQSNVDCKEGLKIES